MSTTWSQGSQPSGPVVNNSGPFQGPPPICFNCGGPHYVVTCPQQTRSSPAGPPAPGYNANQQNEYGPSGSGNFGQRPQWGNGQNSPAATPYPPPKVTPISTRYIAPGAPPQFANAQGSFGPPTAAPPYHQYPNSAPPVPPYANSQQAYGQNSQPYGPSGAPTYSQPPYSAPPTAPPYGNSGWQAPPQTQYSQAPAPPQYGAPGYQNPPPQYAPPPAAAPYLPPSTPYSVHNGPQTGLPGTPIQQQAPKWNSTTPTSSYGASPFQPPNKPQFNAGFKREYSGTPRHQSMSQTNQTPQLTPQQEYGSVGYIVTPQTPSSVSRPSLPPPAQPIQSSPPNQSQHPIMSTESKTTSSASTPSARRASTSSNPQKVQTQSSVSSSKVPGGSDIQREGPVQYEDGELTVEDLEEQDFNWGLEKIFFEQPPTETVCLAQPLSTTWESTPVPLLDTRLNNSVSRYARKDNLKDFMKPIRSQPQWSYLQEDPAFSDVKLEGPLIPLQEVPAWMAARHGEPLPLSKPASSSARKRGRFEEEDVQEDVDNQIKLEAASELANENKPNKRQKIEETEPEMDDAIIVQTSNTPTGGPGTPTFGRAGTPSLSAEDDVWAPQPGEGAAPDPTEALLASLGVSGSPKPVRKGSIPFKDDSAAPYLGVPQSLSPETNQPPVPHAGPAQADAVYSNSPNGMPQQQFNAPYSNSPQGLQQGQFVAPQGQYSNPTIPQNSGPYPNQPYSMPRQNSYDSGISPQGNPPYVNEPYGPPRQNSYSNGVPPQINPPYANQPYSMPRQNSYTNGMPQQSAPPYGNQPHGVSQQAYPPQNQYGPVVPSQVNAPYSVPPNNAPYNNAYGIPPQPYDPPNQYNNGMPPQANGPYQQPNPNYGGPNFGNPPNGMPQQSYPPQQSFNNTQGFQPPRQDSGYGSARGSYSNGIGTNHGLPSMPRQQQQQQQEQKPESHAQAAPPSEVDGANNVPTPLKVEAEETNFFASLPSQLFPQKQKPKLPNVKTDVNSQEGEQDESPLTPTSMEILGKLVPSDGTVRKVKRPQPVVAAAYSRRW